MQSARERSSVSAAEGEERELVAEGGRGPVAEK
jgi:hypothetical protein